VTHNAYAVIADTEIDHNANGISVNPGVIAVRADSYIHHNSNDGIWFNLTSSYDGAASTIFRSTIAYNTGDGVDLGAVSTLPNSFMPYGEFNNIVANGGKELNSATRRFDLDWKNNFWGNNVYFAPNVSACLGQGYDSQGHLAFSPPSGSPPVGPITSSWYLVGSTTKCAYDTVRIYPGEFVTEFIDNRGYGVGGSHTQPSTFAYYSFGDGSCSKVSDPITTVFHGNAGPTAPGATSRASAHVAAHTGWQEQTWRVSQWFYVNGYCVDYDEDLASSDPSFPLVDRFHIRLKSVSSFGFGDPFSYADPVWGDEVVGTPHHEDWIPASLDPVPVCQPTGGHAVDKGGGDTGLTSGFVQGREAVEAAMSVAHHPWFEVWLGNTDTIEQCDHDPAGSDGWVDFIYVP
jgi:hypothetical protein